jgi:error-prone DNA polymerase
VCYCLGITSVNPAEIDLLFERFISVARNESPDIDFEHERRVNAGAKPDHGTGVKVVH